ncbi:MAG: hypothetical protein ABW067_01995, partial [Rhizobacter sp.]
MHDTDEPRDDWLKKALDHAPDSPVPPSLRDTILRASRSPRPAPVAAAPWWSRLSAWLVRPQVAAGFASVAMVTVAGLLWHDEPVPPMPASTPPAAVVVPRSAEAPTPVESRAPEPAAVAEPARTPPAAAPARPPAPKPAPRERERAPPVMKPPLAADKAVRSEAPVAETAVFPPPAPAPAAPVPMAPPVPAETMTERRAAAADAAQADSQRKSMAPSGALRRTQEPAAGAAFAPTPARLADVRAALAATPTLWTWQRETGEAKPGDPALSDWLALLDATTATSWTPAVGPRTGAAELRLLRDGQAVHRWVLTSDAVFWFSPTGV